MTVGDNGEWQHTESEGHSGMGLRIIRYRTELIRGELTIKHEPPGITVVVTFRNPPPTGS